MRADLTEYTEPLSRTPALLRAVIEGQPDAWLDSCHASDVFSPRKAVGHLAYCELEWVVRVRFVLEPETTVAPDLEADGELLNSYRLPQLLDEFESLRGRRIRDLGELGLTEADLDLTADDEEIGRFTLRQLLATWVAHDLYHLGQIFKSYSAVYADRIGAWQHFLNLPHFN